MDIERKPLQGVLNILDFNRHFYYYGIAVLIALLLFIKYVNLPWIFSTLLIAGFSYGLLMPLIVSAYVYDFSGYYEMKWLDKYLSPDSRAQTIVNINAGFDETSYILESKIPDAQIHVYDFYNSDDHTEPAIVRARRVSLVYPHTQQINSQYIPREDESTDIVFLLSAAHEIRDHKEKIGFLKECHRILKSDGKIIMVEHLRDTANFFAFTIGYTHFFSASVWKDAMRAAGFAEIDEEKFTPFMSIFSANK